MLPWFLHAVFVVIVVKRFVHHPHFDKKAEENNNANSNPSKIVVNKEADNKTDTESNGRKTCVTVSTENFVSSRLNGPDLKEGF